MKVKMCNILGISISDLSHLNRITFASTLSVLNLITILI